MNDKNIPCLIQRERYLIEIKLKEGKKISEIAKNIKIIIIYNSKKYKK